MTITTTGETIDYIDARLTRESVKNAKLELWKINRNIKSSHLTEAIARALGYRTHAALLAACDSCTGPEPMHVRIELASVEKALNDMAAERAAREQHHG